MTSQSNQEKPDKHLQGEGHAHHQFNPARAEEFRNPERLKSLKLDQLTDKLNLEPSDHVLDLGTGSGALLPGLSQAVPDGVVIGADVSEEMLEMAHDFVVTKELSNTILVHNTPNQLPLCDRSLNAGVIVSSLHEFSDPLPMLSDLSRTLRPDACLGIIEWRSEETAEGPPLPHRLKPGTIKQWLRETGFDRINVQEWTDRGYDLYRARNRSD